MTNFLGIDSALATLEQARVTILPVPYDATATFHRGARHAPAAVISASLHIEEYDEELRREPCEVGIHTASPVAAEPEDPQSLVGRVEECVRQLLIQGKFVITLGGDHAVAIGAGQAHAAHYADLSVLQIDAHADCRDSYEGSPYNHACVARRLAEKAPVLAVGVRSYSLGEAKARAALPVQWVLAQDIAQTPDEQWMSAVVDSLGPRVYVTFDVDGLDPGIMPATGTPEPGGLGWWQVLKLLRRVAEARQVVGADVCELLPTPGLHACDVLVARLIYKMVGYFVR